MFSGIHISVNAQAKAADEAKQRLRLRYPRSLPQPRRREPFRVLLRLPCVNKIPIVHQPGSFSHSSIGVSSPTRMDSRMPGADRR